MKNMFDESGHITAEIYDQFHQGLLDSHETLEILDHIAQCQTCALRLADSTSQHETVSPPGGFHAEIARKVMERPAKKYDFLLYAIRVSVCVCATLVIFFTGTLNYSAPPKKVEPPNRQFIDSINQNLKNFSNHIINLEGFSYDKEK